LTDLRISKILACVGKDVMPSAASAPAARPLEGLVVADFSRVLAGPLATMTLADLGATVVKVEHPDGGDDTRRWGPPWTDAGASYFVAANRGKRSLLLDLRDPADLKLAHELVARADVMVENFRAGQLNKYGLDPASTMAANPCLIHCSITGFGSAAGAHLPGYDFVVQAVGGLMSITGPPTGDPQKVGVALVDVLTGKDAVIGILAALRHRDLTGEGQHVEVALLQSLIGALVNQASAFLATGESPRAMGNRHPSIAPYETLNCADGLLAVACGNDRQFARLCEALAVPALISDGRFGTNADRVANRSTLVELLEARLRHDTAVEWEKRLTSVDIPAGQVNDIADGIALARRLGLNVITDIAGGTPQVAHPIQYSAFEPSPATSPPALGEHDTEIRKWLSGTPFQRIGQLLSMNTPARDFDPTDPAGIDPFLSQDERDIRDVVRRFCDDRVEPHVARWFEQGSIPDIRDLTVELGSLGILGMHLDGYGCSGMTATEYGLACLELEATDSGLRSLVSVQGSLAMFAIHHWGSEEQKQHWLPQMATGRAIGCFGLTEPDAGSDPASMRSRARRDGDDWVLDARKMWITNGSIADVAVVWAQTAEGIRGFVVPTDTPGFSAPLINHKMSLRASVTSELVLDAVRLPSDAVLPDAAGLRGPLTCLNEARYGIVWGAIGAARSSLYAAIDYANIRAQFGRPVSAFQLTQQKIADMTLEVVKGTLLALHLGRLKDSSGVLPAQISLGKLNNVREALEVCRTARTVLGANGISLEYPVIRHMNNLESVLTYEGTSEMHALSIGQAMTGQQAFR